MCDWSSDVCSSDLRPPIQLGGLAALTGPQEVFEGMRARLKVKRDKMVASLNEMGLKTLLPPGTFYAFPDITSTGMDSKQFTDYLLNEFGVAVVAGTAFGSQGEGYVRMTFAVPDAEIEEGLNRMRKAMERLK
jgi:aminotransferase